MPEMMDNGFRPKVGQRVKIVGNSHPRLIGIEAEVVAVYEEDGHWWADKKFVDPWTGRVVIGCGRLGGLEPIPG
jgi:hypothetical protein